MSKLLAWSPITTLTSQMSKHLMISGEVVKEIHDEDLEWEPMRQYATTAANCAILMVGVRRICRKSCTRSTNRDMTVRSLGSRSTIVLTYAADQSIMIRMCDVWISWNAGTGTYLIDTYQVSPGARGLRNWPEDANHVQSVP